MEKILTTVNMTLSNEVRDLLNVDTAWIAHPNSTLKKKYFGYINFN